MPASIKPISRTASLTISLGTVGDKVVKKTISVSRLGTATTASSLNTVMMALIPCLAYPVSAIKIRDIALLESGE